MNDFAGSLVKAPCFLRPGKHAMHTGSLVIRRILAAALSKLVQLQASLVITTLNREINYSPNPIRRG
jgi:hypothetical protein